MVSFCGYNFYYKGDISLLELPKIAILGTRRPSRYSKEVTAQLSKILSKKYVIVSGGAMGVDAIAHKNASKTIMVSPAGIDIYYPKVNSSLIKEIAKNHLLITKYKEGFMPRPYTFLERNQIIVDISEFLIIVEADENSGSYRSFEIAKKSGKKIYSVPHRIGESLATNRLAEEGEIELIFDIEKFANGLGIKKNSGKIIDYNEAFRIYGEKLYEMELFGEIEVKEGKVYFK
jgi:DNA processing protein